MPRALTETEKQEQRQRLLEKGKAAVLAYGIRKVSVDDIAKAAGIAKGTFYQHFETKEQYLYALIEMIHREAFKQAEQIILGGALNGGDFRENIRAFLQKIFYWPEMVFFIQNETDIKILFGTVTNRERLSFKELEVSLFEGILRLAGINTGKVKPGVVHNYIHLLFMMKGSEYMTDEDLQETLDLIMGSLISYILS